MISARLSYTLVALHAAYLESYLGRQKLTNSPSIVALNSITVSIILTTNKKSIDKTWPLFQKEQASHPPGLFGVVVGQP